MARRVAGRGRHVRCGLLGAALAFAGFLLLPEGAQAAAPFRDLQGSWAAQVVENAVRDGIVQGYPDGTFRPEAPVSRAEALKLLAAAVTLAPEAGPAASSGAVGASDLAMVAKQVAAPAGDGFVRQGWAAAVAQEGWLLPNEQDLPLPVEAPATRAEVAAWAARALDLPQSFPPGLSFRDWAEVPVALRTAVAEAERAGLVLGYPDGRLRPQAAITRAEAVAVAERVRQYLRDRAKGAGLDPVPLLERAGVAWRLDPARRTLTLTPPGGASAELRAGSDRVRFSNGSSDLLGFSPLWENGRLLVPELFLERLFALQGAVDASGREVLQSAVLLDASARRWPAPGQDPRLDPSLAPAAQAATALAHAAATLPATGGTAGAESLGEWVSPGRSQYYSPSDWQSLAELWAPWDGQPVVAAFADAPGSAVVVLGDAASGRAWASHWSLQSGGRWALDQELDYPEAGGLTARLFDPRQVAMIAGPVTSPGTLRLEPGVLRFAAVFRLWIDGRPVRVERDLGTTEAALRAGLPSLEAGSHLVVVAAWQTAMGPWLWAGWLESGGATGP